MGVRGILVDLSRVSRGIRGVPGAFKGVLRGFKGVLGTLGEYLLEIGGSLEA